LIADDEPATAGGGERDLVLQRISAQLDGISAKLPVMERRESRLIFWTRIIVVIIVAALVVAYVLGFLAWRHGEQRINAQTAQIARLEKRDAALVRANCETGNEVRAEDLKIQREFIEFVRVTGTDPASPAVRAEAARLLAGFQVKDRQRRCP